MKFLVDEEKDIHYIRMYNNDTVVCYKIQKGP